MWHVNRLVFFVVVFCFFFVFCLFVFCLFVFCLFVFLLVFVYFVLLLLLFFWNGGCGWGGRGSKTNLDICLLQFCLMFLGLIIEMNKLLSCTFQVTILIVQKTFPVNVPK